MEYFDDLSIHTDTVFMWVYVTFWFQQFIFLSTSYREVRHYCFVNYVHQAEEKQLCSKEPEESGQVEYTARTLCSAK